MQRTIPRLAYAIPVQQAAPELRHQQISSNVAHLKASCGDEAIRAAMRLAPGEAMLLLDEVCFNRLCRPVMRSLSYYTNFFDFSILRKLL